MHGLWALDVCSAFLSSVPPAPSLFITLQRHATNKLQNKVGQRIWLASRAKRDIVTCYSTCRSSLIPEKLITTEQQREGEKRKKREEESEDCISLGLTHLDFEVDTEILIYWHWTCPFTQSKHSLLDLLLPSDLNIVALNFIILLFPIWRAHPSSP